MEAILTLLNVVGYREDALGRATGPYFVRRCSSLPDAQSLCLARLWRDGDAFFAVAIVREDWSEVVRYRRLPLSRQRLQLEEEWGEVLWRQRTKGARLSIGISGRRVKSFGGNGNERS